MCEKQNVRKDDTARDIKESMNGRAGCKLTDNGAESMKRMRGEENVPMELPQVTLKELARAECMSVCKCWFKT